MNARPPKIAILLLLICSVGQCLKAQTKIYGKLISPDGKPLVNASVLLLAGKDSALNKGTLTDEYGLYNFENVSPGAYLISVAYIGFDPAYTPFINITGDKTLFEVKTIQLASTKQLSSVVVSAKKPLYEQKIDRLVINVAQAIEFTGISALELLERSPGIRVDRISSSILVNGKNRVIVLINGKRTYMDMGAILAMLSGLPSGSVEKIEIITTPPGNFDADGNAGILNIVLKSNNQFGTYGTYTLSGGFSRGAQGSGYLTMNHRQQKLNLSGSISFSGIHMHQYWNNYHASSDKQLFTEDYSDDHRNGVQTFLQAQFGIDYEITKKSSLGASLSGFYRTWTMESINHSSIDINENLDTTVNIVNNEIHITSNVDANLNFQEKFKADEKIIFNVDYLFYKDKNPNTYLNSYYDYNGQFLGTQNVQSDKRTPLTILVAAADYTKKISKKMDLEAGLKASSSNFTDGVQVESLSGTGWITDSLLTGSHGLKELISAVYLSLNLKASEKNSFKAGLRYEHTRSQLSTQYDQDTIDRNYGNLFPSFFFQHTLKEGTYLNFSYSRRIWRPSFSTLAPWVIFLDPKTFQTGNPGLQPAITDQVSTAFTYKNKIVTISYSYTANPICQRPILDSLSNQLITSYQNGISQAYASISFSLPFTVSAWWNMQNYLQFGINWFNDNYLMVYHSRQNGYSLNSTQNFLLPKNVSITLSCYYGSKWVWGLYTNASYVMLDAGIQKKWPKKNSTLTLNLNNLLNSNRGSASAVIPAEHLVMKYTNTYGYPGISLSFTHNFGNEKVKNKGNALTGAEEEKGRAY